MSNPPRHPVTIQEQRAIDRSVVTPASIQAARIAAFLERQVLTRDFGVTFDPFREGQILRDRRTK